MRWAVTVAMIGAVAALHGAPAAGQKARSAGGDAVAQQQLQQLQQLASERTALQSENARLKEQLAESQRKLDTLKAEQGALARRAQSAEATAARLVTGNAAAAEGALRSRTQMEELVERFRATAESLREVEDERNALRDQAQGSERQLATCREHNAALLKINEEVLVRLENTGFWSKLAANEPFTQLKRTELENLADGYRSQAAEFAVPAPPSPPLAGTP